MCIGWIGSLFTTMNRDDTKVLDFVNMTSLQSWAFRSSDLRAGYVLGREYKYIFDASVPM